MGKVHVFNAGPCLLPQVAYDNAIEAIKDFKGTGVSVLSISHRTPGWDETMDECRALWHELLNIPSTLPSQPFLILQLCQVQSPYNESDKFPF